MMDTFYSKEQAVAVYRDLCRTAEQPDMRAALAKIAMGAGLPFLQAVDTADAIAAGVQAHMDAAEAIFDDAEAFVDDFLDRMDAAEAPEDLVNETLFGLQLFADPNAMAALQRGISGKEIFENRSPVFEGDYAQRRQQLREQLLHMNVTPTRLDEMLLRLAGSSDYVTAAAQIGHDQYARKCMAAMRLHLQHSDELTPQKAAIIVSTWLDMQQLESDLAKSDKVYTIAKAIISIVALAGVICLAIFMPEAKGVYKTVFSMLTLLGGMELADSIHEPLAQWIGQLAITLPDKLRHGKQQLDKVFARTNAQDEALCPDDELDEELDDDAFLITYF